MSEVLYIDDDGLVDLLMIEVDFDVREFVLDWLNCDFVFSYIL